MFGKRVLAFPVMAAAALVVTGCAAGSTPGHSGSSTPATVTLGQEFPAMKAAVRSASSVTLSGTVLDSGKRESLDMVLTKSGALSGWVEENGAKFTLLVTHGKPYIKINKAFLKQAQVPTTTCKTVCGKYLELPQSSAQQMTSGLSLTAMVDQAFKTPPTAAQAKVVLTQSQYGGQPAWFGRYGTYTVDIARGGKPYLLAMTAQNGQVLQFSGWDTATVPGPPKARKIVSVTQL
jgi:hypothetical protein